LPLAAPLAARARQLALAAVEAMPPTIGYVGIDLVLGADADGSQDYILEVNPRLTTSYVGLRVACRQNLAAAMLDIAAQRTATLSFGDEPLEFLSDGTIGAPFCAGS
jgi:predicted ATP-grasp superfamily ATP-dependent carboligase